MRTVHVCYGDGGRNSNGGRDFTLRFLAQSPADLVNPTADAVSMLSIVSLHRVSPYSSHLCSPPRIAHHISLCPPSSPDSSAVRLSSSLSPCPKFKPPQAAPPPSTDHAPATTLPCPPTKCLHAKAAQQSDFLDFLDFWDFLDFLAVAMAFAVALSCDFLLWLLTAAVGCACGLWLYAVGSGCRLWL